MFKITGGKGIHLKLPNGYTISSQFGYGNYCENYSDYELQEKMSKPSIGVDVESNTCEIAIFDYNDNWVTGEVLDKIGEFNHDDIVCGYINMVDWLKIVNYVSLLKAKTEEE